MNIRIAGGLSQVLSDGENLYTYGYNRIAQVSDDTTGYFLDDVLGSVRQVVDPDGEIVLGREYSPYGETISSTGDFDTDFGYTGELTDGTGLVNLRARYYDPGTGRFITKDTWAGDYQMPVTLVKWLYANSNPMRYMDPSGFMSISECYALHICKNKHITKIYRYINDTIIKELVCDIPPDYYYELPDKFPVETLSTSNKGYDFIRQEETYPERGWEKWPYGDLGPRKGTCTIGYGTVLSSPDLGNCDYDHVIAQNIRTVTAKMTGIVKPLFDQKGLMNGLSEDDANDLLINHVKEFPEIYIKEYIPGVYLSQNEYDALISYIYNGGSVLDLADHLKTYQTDQVAMEILGNTYINNGGKVMELTALDTRRVQEVELFLNGDYNYRGR